MGGVEIVPVADAGSKKAFIELPYRLYRDDPHWVAPLRIAVKELLDTAKHPFYANAEIQCFLARRGGQVIGRIAAIHDRAHNKFHDEAAGHFGFFECENDPDAARALLAAAREWCRERGLSIFRGPFNPSSNYECALLVDGFDTDPMVMMPHNPPYYAALLEQAGLRKAKDLLAYYTPTAEIADRKVNRVADRALADGITVRSIDMKNFQRDVESVWDVYNAAWAHNWGFVPMTREEFFAMGKEMKMILDPDLVLLGEAKGRVVGFALALPDVNQALKRANGKLFPLGLFKILYYRRVIKSTRVLALGVVEEFRTAGVAAGFYATLIRNARRKGYTQCEMSWVLEDNALMNRSAQAMGARRYKTYRIYEWN